MKSGSSRRIHRSKAKQHRSARKADDRRILDSGSTLVLASYGVPDAMGTVPSVTYANGVTVDYTYEATTGKMRTLKASSVAGGTIADYSYAVDDEGLLRAVTDNLVRDGIDLSESFQYDKTHRLVEARGPYGDRTTPEKTLRYTYGADGQPLTFGDRILAYGANEHRLEDSGVVRYTGFDAEGNVTERRRTNGSTKTLTYSYHNRIKSVTMSGNETGQVNFTYDSGGERFLKRYQTSGVDLYTYNMASEYQMRRVSGEEIHTLLVNKADGALASLSFNSLYLISNAAAPPSLYMQRIAADAREVPNLSSRNLGTKGPQIMRSLRSNAELFFAALVASWGERGGPPFFFETEKEKLRAVHDAVVALFGIGSLVTLIAFVRWWRKDRINLVWNLPRAFGRITAFALVVTFFSGVTNCVGVTSGGDNEISDGILAAAAASGAFADPENPDIPALIAEMDGLIGNHFYITNQINSNHLVTDVNGKVVCKYVYEPYGKLNMILTDTDPDKDGSHFLALKKFTGQEFDYETGLYNYNARLYDQETGRFLQPDPVHAEHVGYDNYDRYQYVHSNPVNFTDPTGETVAGTDPTAEGIFLQQAILLTMFRSSTDAALIAPGHNYSGDKNFDPYSKFHNKYKRNAKLFEVYFASVAMGNTPGEAVANTALFLFLTYRLSPKAGTPMDLAAVYHDRNVPGSQGKFGPRYDHKHRKADVGWIKRAWQHSYDFDYYSKHPGQYLIDRFIVLPLGTLIFTVDYILRNVSMLVTWGARQLHMKGARFHVRGARYRCCRL